MSQCPFKPPYPKPLSSDQKRSWINLIRRARKSWIHTLYEGSYKNDLTQVKLPGRKLFILKKPEDIREVMGSNYKSFPKNQLNHEMLEPLLGNSIFTTNGEVWERQRRMLDPAFATAGLKAIFPTMKSTVEGMLERMEQHPEEKPFLVDEVMTHVTADIIMRTILSYPLPEGESYKLFHNFEVFQEKALRLNLLRTFRLPKLLNPYDFYQWKRSGSAIRKFITTIIHERLISGEKKPDILQGLIEAKDPKTNTSFSEIELVDQVVMLFLAGHETSASALSWALYILSHEKETLKKLQNEVSEVAGGFSGLTFKNVHKLKLTRDVFKETLRLYPPVAFLSRTASQDGSFQGCPVSKGDIVNLSPYITQRHVKYWDDPNAFKPERFQNREVKEAKEMYSPFGMGPRICIGAAFALQEALLVLAGIVDKYDLSLDENHTPEPGVRITLRSLNGMKIRIKRR